MYTPPVGPVSEALRAVQQIHKTSKAHAGFISALNVKGFAGVVCDGVASPLNRCEDLLSRRLMAS